MYTSPPNSVTKTATCLSSLVYRAVEIACPGEWDPFGWANLLDANEDGRTDDLLLTPKFDIIVSD